MFAANKGSRLDYIRNVASGGEMSRLALCTKSLVADAITLPTLIFDEIDTGVSGDVALKMGHILRDLANRHQVISITHTPQIAARADHHYLVYKYIEGETTLSAVKLLEQKERISEIAVMLSGNPPSKSALDNAKELIKM
jgi:DNA repair protein RecN (Recombination protein N)